MPKTDSVDTRESGMGKKIVPYRAQKYPLPWEQRVGIKKIRRNTENQSCGEKSQALRATTAQQSKNA